MLSNANGLKDVHFYRHGVKYMYHVCTRCSPDNVVLLNKMEFLT